MYIFAKHLEIINRIYYSSLTLVEKVTQTSPDRKITNKDCTFVYLFSFFLFLFSLAYFFCFCEMLYRVLAYDKKRIVLKVASGNILRYSYFNKSVFLLPRFITQIWGGCASMPPILRRGTGCDM